MKPKLVYALVLAAVGFFLFLKFRGDQAPSTEVAEKEAKFRRAAFDPSDPDARPQGKHRLRPDRDETSGNPKKEIGADDLEHWLAGLKGDTRSIAEAYAAVGVLNNDPELIRKALEMDPDNPHLIYIGATSGHFSEDERFALAERFFQKDPDNAMAAYLYAARLLEANDPEAAIEILSDANDKGRMDDYNGRMSELFEEALGGAGMSRDTAQFVSISNLRLPYVSDLSSMVDSLNELAKASSPEDAAKINALSAAMGKRLGEQMGSGTIINHLTGLKLEEKTLAGLPGDAPSPYEGLTVAEARESLAIERENLKQIISRFPAVETLLPGNAELTNGYVERFRTMGEEEAIRWLLEKTGGTE